MRLKCLRFIPTLDVLKRAQQNLIEDHSEIAKTLVPRMVVALPRISITTDLAFRGYYYEAMVLLRSAIEGIFRFSLEVVQELEDDFSGILQDLRDKAKQNLERMEKEIQVLETEIQGENVPEERIEKEPFLRELERKLQVSILQLMVGGMQQILKVHWR